LTLLRIILLTEYACHVDGLLVGLEGHDSSIEFGRGVYDVEHAAPESIDQYTTRTSKVAAPRP
jgi:hypothetical protein